MLKTRNISTSQKDNTSMKIYWFVLKFALIVPFVHAYLKLLGYNRTLVLLKKFIPANSGHTPLSNNQEFPAATIRKLVRQVRLHSPLPGTCLSRSLTLWMQLQRMGVDTRLCIGTQTESNTFTAHAWLEYQGQPLNAGDHIRQHYAAFDRPMTADTW